MNTSINDTVINRRQNAIANGNSLNSEQQQWQAQIDDKLYKQWVFQSIGAISMLWFVSIVFIMAIVAPKFVHYSIPPGLYILYQLVVVYKQHKSQKNFPDSEKDQKIMKQLELIENYILLFLGIFAIMIIAFEDILPYYLLPFLIVCIFIRYKIYSISTKNGDCVYIWDFGMIGYRFFYCVQYFSIAMKLNKQFSWSWKEIFWPFWVFFAINIGIIFALMLMVVSKICQYFQKEVLMFEVKGIFWMFLLVTLHTGMLCFMVFGIVDYLDNDNKKFLNYSIIVNTSISFFMIFFTFLIRKDIQKFMKLVISEDGSQQDESGSAFHQPNYVARTFNNYNQQLQQQKQKKKYEIWKSNIIEVFPRYLIKTSETYFKKADFHNSNKKKNNELSCLDIEEQNSQQKIKKIEKSQSLNEDGSCQINKMNKSWGNKFDSNQQSDQTLNSLQELNVISDSKNRLSEQQIKLNELTEYQRVSLKYPNSARQSISTLKEIEEDSKRQKTEASEKNDNNKKEEDQMCIICYEQKADSVFLDCYHGGLCYQCAIQSFETSSQCYLCRSEIKEILQIKKQIANKYKVISATQLVDCGDVN